MSKKDKDPWVRIINVSDPILHKKGYTLYKVTSKVFPRNSVEAVTEVTVWKRYNDFKKLHKALSTIHQNLHLRGTFPPFAKARLFGRFDKSVIEERRLSALQLLQFAANHPPLFTSQIFVKFFEGGHVVDENKVSSEPQENLVENIPPFSSVGQLNIIHSNSNSFEDRSSECEYKETTNTLGGTWQHHQVPDNISLGSQCTEDDEDDRTTFTDDESIASKPSINLAEFDPLFESENKDSTSGNKLIHQDNVCNNWLLSALKSCSNSDAEKDLENILEFPTPFSDVETTDDAITPSTDSYFLNNVNSESKNEEFTYFSSTTGEKSFNISEFDPLANKENSLNESEGDFYNCDDFATTPTAYKTEFQRQPSFIIYASKFVLCAQDAEEKHNYTDAFESYKKAIDVLLQGIQKECHPDLKDAVQKKVLLYLMRAEELYENKLPKGNSHEKLKVQSSCTVPFDKISTLKGCTQDLNKYKVLGVLGKVLLVLDISNNNTYVVKTFYKSSLPKSFDSPHIIPQTVPYMVKLFQIYETSYAIFLILEHATGGRLWDYISSFLQRSPVSPCSDGTYLYVDPVNKAALCNVYSGKKISESKTATSMNSANLVDSDLTPSENCPSSYVALFKRYAASVNKEETVALAKYNQYNLVPFSEREKNVIHESNLCSTQCDSLSSSIPELKSKDDKDESTRSSKIQQQQHKNTRNRLSSSTGSLESALSQKTCIFEAFNEMDEAVSNALKKPTHLPESCVYLWAAEMVIALESLHKLGIMWMDFHPDNILLGAEGHILVTYESRWNCVDLIINEKAKENLFCAPEVGSVFPVTVDCDWWSLGVLLFELLTGRSFVSCHPAGITRHTVLHFPSDVSSDAKDFITKLLQYNPTERLGSGIYGIEEIKSHPFFRYVDWESLYQS